MLPRVTRSPVVVKQLKGVTVLDVQNSVRIPSVFKCSSSRTGGIVASPDMTFGHWGLVHAATVRVTFPGEMWLNACVYLASCRCSSTHAWCLSVRYLQYPGTHSRRSIPVITLLDSSLRNAQSNRGGLSFRIILCDCDVPGRKPPEDVELRQNSPLL